MTSSQDKGVGSTADAATEYFFDTLDHYREIVLERVRALIPAHGRYHTTLYGPMLDYPLREGKCLRSALFLSMCQACGGSLQDGLDTAAALEMFHNAFLIHDDCQDESEDRRGLPTLHIRHGVPIAINVGDALNMLALSTLLGNTGVIGLERSLSVIEEISRMARETTEGQSIELDWVAGGSAPSNLRDYLLMTYKKTAWYTCIAPLRLGAIMADIAPERLGPLIPFGMKIGTAFQIQDDVLNLEGEEKLYGKEINGDIYEGKYTLMIIHAMAAADAAERQRLNAIYAKPRAEKTAADVAFVLDAIRRAGSMTYARGVSHRLTLSAKRMLDHRFDWIPPSPHRQFIEGMIHYMIARPL